MKTSILAPSLLLAALSLASCGKQALCTLEVSNPAAVAREGEMAEVDAAALSALKSQPFRLLDSKGKEVATQWTHDGHLIFPVSLGASSSATYRAVKGTPTKTDTLVYGRLFKERDDDFAWENDRAGYRAYGPALQARGERGFGYDIFTKCVTHPVLEKFYANECDHEAWSKINAWRRNGQKAKGDSLERVISYHVDHGEGMDVFSVGPTLGGGTAALLDADGQIVYPWCYDQCEILDCGPLRFTVRLKFKPSPVGNDQNVVETRTISLDRGSFLNRTVEHYDGLTATRPIVAGISLREQNPDGYYMNTSAGYVAYADSTDNAHVGNGVIYVAALSPQFTATKVVPYTASERRNHGNALGHVLAQGSYAPASDFVYYWGSGWSKGFMPSMDAWKAYLDHYSRCLAAPLKVSVK